MSALSRLTGVVRCFLCKRAVAVGPARREGEPGTAYMARHGDCPASGGPVIIYSAGWLRLDVANPESRAAIGPVPYDSTPERLARHQAWMRRMAMELFGRRP